MRLPGLGLIRGEGLAIMLPPGLGLIRGEGLMRGDGLAIIELVPALGVVDVVPAPDIAPVVPAVPGSGLGLADMVVPLLRRVGFLAVVAGVSAKSPSTTNAPVRTHMLTIVTRFFMRLLLG